MIFHVYLTIMRVLLACHDPIASGGEFDSTLPGDIQYDFVDIYDYRARFVPEKELQAEQDAIVSKYIDEDGEPKPGANFKDMDKEIRALVESKADPSRYDALMEEYRRTHPDRTNYKTWDAIPASRYDYVFSVHCSTTPWTHEDYNDLEELDMFTEFVRGAVRVLMSGGKFLMPIPSELTPKSLGKIKNSLEPLGVDVFFDKIGKKSGQPLTALRPYPYFWEREYGAFLLKGAIDNIVIRCVKRAAGGRRRKTRRQRRPVTTRKRRRSAMTRRRS
jgi:hypothetical protein